MSARAVGVLLGHAWRLHRRPLVVMTPALMLFQFLLTRLAPGPEDTARFTGLLALIPPQLRTMAGGDLALASTDGFLALGYAHPFFLLILAVWTVRLSSASLAGEIGRGTMDLLGARPIARADLVIAGSCAIAIGLAVLTMAAWLGTAVGLTQRQLGVGPLPFLHIAITAWLLFMAWGSVGLVASALQRESGPAIAWTSGLIAASFVLEYLARLWKTISVLRPWSLFAHYQPPDIVRSGVSSQTIAVFGGVWLVAMAIALAVFSRRDL